MPLARKIAHRKAPEYPEPYEDIENIAMMGLIKAVEKFDPNKGAAFSSFAVPYIEGELLHYFRDRWGINPKVPRREIELSSRIIRAQKRCGLVELDEAAIARGLRVTPQKIRNSIEARTRKPVKSLEQDAIQLGEESQIEEDFSWIKSRVALLPEPYQSVLIDLRLRKQTVNQIARRHRVNVAQVCEWADQGLLKLKAQSCHEFPSC